HRGLAGGERKIVRRALARARPAKSGAALRPAGRARRLLRLPVLGPCRIRHRSESADRRRQLSGHVLSIYAVMETKGKTMSAVAKHLRLTHHGAIRLVQAAIAKAEAMGVPQCIAVVDDGGHLLAFGRMDGAKFLSIDSSTRKAVTAASSRAPTGN